MAAELRDLSAEQNAAVALRLQPGNGTRLNVSELGASISVPPRRGSFGHPWKPSLIGFGLRLARGVVFDRQSGKAIEPIIDNVKVSGERGKAQPTLRLDTATATAAGESWACVEVEPDEEGLLTAKTVKIIHARDPLNSGRPGVGRHPLVMIVWQGGRPRLAIANAMYNLQYLRWQPPAGAGQVRHFFL